jgi:MOSC domain-containing protein YiiM
MPDLRSLTSRFVHPGIVEAIWLRPARGVAAVAVQSAEAVVARGLLGDRSAERTTGGKRQVTLIQAEHLPLIARWSGVPTIDAGSLRRNLVIAGFNLLSARSPFADQIVHVVIGNAVLVVTGDCAPCSKMEDLLGRGGYNALRGHGGVTARVVQGGRIAIGDSIRVVTGS